MPNLSNLVASMEQTVDQFELNQGETLVFKVSVSLSISIFDTLFRKHKYCCFFCYVKAIVCEGNCL